jgi:hypothetical protein
MSQMILFALCLALQAVQQILDFSVFKSVIFVSLNAMIYSYLKMEKKILNLKGSGQIGIATLIPQTTTPAIVTSMF